MFCQAQHQHIPNMHCSSENCCDKSQQRSPNKNPSDDTKTTENHCQKCEFVGKTAAGLKMHMTVVHKQKSLMRSFSRVTCAK